MPTCTNPRHDHDEPAGAEVPAHYAPASAEHHDDGVAVLIAPAPMRCHDCGEALHYDLDAETYSHDDPAAACFLHAAGVPEDGTPCTTIDDEVSEAMARGEEHVARERFGDAAVDAAIRRLVEAEGLDFDACVEHANGFGR